MELNQRLADFFEVAAEDGRLGPAHVSVYLALLHECHRCGGSTGPVGIAAGRVMKAARIRARHTYQKCLRELHHYGYIRYCPSFHPSGGSTVTLRAL